MRETISIHLQFIVFSLLPKPIVLPLCAEQESYERLKSITQFSPMEKGYLILNSLRPRSSEAGRHDNSGRIKSHRKSTVLF